jgi:hypothetical protein
MPFKLPDNPSRIAPALRIYLHADTATGSGVMRIKEFEFFEVESPLPARNADRGEQNQVSEDPQLWLLPRGPRNNITSAGNRPRCG